MLDSFIVFFVTIFLYTNILSANNDTFFCFISYLYFIYFPFLIVLAWSIISDHGNANLFQYEVTFATMPGKFFYPVKGISLHFLLVKSFETIMNTS